MSKKNQKGFTLLELLVVVAIIGVIATIGIVSLSSFRVKGRDTKRIADLKSIQGALELAYEAANPKTYPAGPENSCPWPSGAGNILTLAGQRSLPSDPINGSSGGKTYCYQYIQQNSGQGYTLAAQLENGNNNPNDRIKTNVAVGPLNCSAADIYCVGL